MGIVLNLNLIESWRGPFLLPPMRGDAYYALMAASALLVLLAVAHSRSGFLVRHWPSGAVLLLVPGALASAHVVVLHIWPGTYAWLTAGKGLLVPLLVLLPLALAAAYCRPLEAVLVGLVTSLGMALWHTHNPLTSLEGAYLALFLSALLTQPYRGRLPHLLRQPLLAGPLAAVMAWPLAFVSAYALTFSPPLTSLEVALDAAVLHGGLLILQAGMAGLILQFLYLTPLGQPVPVPSRLPAYARTLRGQVLAAYLPVATVAVLTVLGVSVQAAVSSASKWALDEAARDASSGAERLARAVERGQGALATDIHLCPSASVCDQQWLEERLSQDSLFTALLLVDDGGKVLAASPGDESTNTLTGPELETLASLPPSSAGLTPIHRSHGEPVIAALSPQGPAGRLVGRMNPLGSRAWQDIVSDLQWTMDAGNGSVVDEERHILGHPDPAYVLTLWDAQPQYARPYATATGTAYEAPDSSGMRHLVYVLPVAGLPWRVVIEVPKEVVLSLALDLALPTLALTGALAAVGTALVWLGAWRYSRPLVDLAVTASEIAAGDLTVSVEAQGHDEIGHLRRCFEEMRLSLYRRLSDLALLLDVTRSVSASHDWSFEPILRAAMTGTQAVAASVCLRREGETYAPVAQEGEFSGWDEILPHMQHIAREATRQRRPLPVRSVARYLRTASPQTVASDIRSAICLPLVAGERAVGVMWVLYADRRHFDEQVVRLLDTLAAQAGVVYENNRLLTEAQSERGRLRAILAGTMDPIIVVDQQGKLVLVNPAAQQKLGIDGQGSGVLLRDVISDASMSILVETPLESSCLTRELHLADGTTLYASVSPVDLTAGGSVGRVIVMRDITALKRREHAQADFVSTLSRDLRTPLTFLRGYASMIPRVGDLNSQQSDFVERIIRNVDYVSGLLDNLVDLNSIELGEGARLERCSVAGAIEAALASLRPEVEKREHNVRLSLPPAPPIVEADRNLLIRALTCLIDNAAKYTSKGGTIGIQVTHEDNGVSVTVTDSGIGIGSADQMRVFDRFYRVDRTEVQSVPGYGLGLPIAKAIADWHGGRIWVESELGRGSRFHLWLPRHGDAAGLVGEQRGDGLARQVAADRLSEDRRH